VNSRVHITDTVNTEYVPVQHWLLSLPSGHKLHFL